MGIKQFFQKIGRGIKRVAGKVWKGIKKGVGFVGKIFKPVVKIAKPILGGLSMLPGKLGMVGKVGSAVADVAHSIVDQIPNQQAKDKLNAVIDKGKAAVDTGQHKMQQVAGKVAPWAKFGQDLIQQSGQIGSKFKAAVKPITQVLAVPMAQ